MKNISHGKNNREKGNEMIVTETELGLRKAPTQSWLSLSDEF